MALNLTRAAEWFLRSSRPLVIGMIHVPALVGTPLNRLKIDEIAEKVVAETQIYANTQIDGLIFENMHDLPYSRSEDLGPEITAAMTRVCLDARNELLKRSELLLGIQVLAGGNEKAMAVALAAGLDFIRAESFVFAHVADEGWMDACAGRLLRYRKKIEASNVAVLTDIKKKHSAHAITSDVLISETAHAAEFFCADGLIVTGTATGAPAQPKDLEEVRSAVKLPVLIGSGLTIDNCHEYRNAHGFIVGSYFKRNGHWANPLDSKRINDFIAKVHELKRDQ
ncbi:hypothetical protein M3Y98_00834900 [Aphelenchoides besseyi]|nr:hypothetical protein M3Y98_00834900 [Aphelenchoides besseyi]